MDKPAKRIYLCLAHMSEDGVELTTSRMPLKLAS